MHDSIGTQFSWGPIVRSITGEQEESVPFHAVTSLALYVARNFGQCDLALYPIYIVALTTIPSQCTCKWVLIIPHLLII